MAREEEREPEQDPEMEEEEEEEESEDDDLEKPLKEARKDAVYDVAGIQDKLEDISWPSEVEWIHSLSVSVPIDSTVNAEDDLAREMSFYTLALEGARLAYGKMQELGIPFLRPDDYYAEMVKSDSHMLKVKDQLLTQKQQLEAEQERRKAREAKKIAKQVQAEKLKERAKQKKQDFENVKKWRKMRNDSGYKDGEEDFPMDAEDAPPASKRKKAGNTVAPWDRSGGKSAKANTRGRPNARGGGKRGKTRQQRDSKFGHGGRKGLRKKNTAESAADMSFKKGRPQKKQRVK